jgi:hypothetical protein
MEVSGWLHIQSVHFPLVPVEQEAVWEGPIAGMVVFVKTKQYFKNYVAR